MTNGDNQLSGWTERKLHSTSQSRAGTKERTWSQSGGLLPVWSTVAFWILTKPLQEVRSANRWDASKTRPPAAGAGQQKGPGSWAQQHPAHVAQRRSQAAHAGRSASAAISTWTLASQLPLLQASWQLFAGKTLPQPAGGRNAFQEFVDSWSTDFHHAAGINKLISHWQKCADCHGSYFDL